MAFKDIDTLVMAVKGPLRPSLLPPKGAFMVRVRVRNGLLKSAGACYGSGVRHVGQIVPALPGPGHCHAGARSSDSFAGIVKLAIPPI